ncbi:MAG: very short patch repair endonuclease [Verrucomicrobiota bacterium]
MADVFSKAKRSQVMSRIRSRGNRATELALVTLLRANGITGWRRHQKLMVKKLMVDGGGKRGLNDQPSTKDHPLTVRPDFVFRQHRLAVFVDGCFWHACPRHATKPRSNAAFWRRKLARNRARDALVTRELRRAGWRVVRIWECSLRKNPQACVRRVCSHF